MTEKRKTNDELLIRIKNGDENAKDEIIRQNIGLVKMVAKRFLGRGHEMDDLFQIGCVGLIKAVDKFDLSFGVAFSTYAVPMIIGEIKRFIRDDGIIKVSRAYKDLSMKAQSVREKIISQTGNEPSILTIAKALDVSPEELSTALEAVAKPNSIYEKPDDGYNEGCAIIDRMASPTDFQEEVENKMMLYAAFSGMSEREKTVIYMRYFKNKTQSEIGKLLGVSQVQVSRMEKRILLKMREKLLS